MMDNLHQWHCHEAEIYDTSSSERMKVNVLEMKCLRSFGGVSKMDKFRNEEDAGIERELVSRADQRVWRWFGLVERMDEFRMARRELMAGVSGGQVRGRPRLGWINGEKVLLGKGGIRGGGSATMCKKYERVESPGTVSDKMISIPAIFLHF